MELIRVFGDPVATDSFLAWARDRKLPFVWGEGKVLSAQFMVSKRDMGDALWDQIARSLVPSTRCIRIRIVEGRNRPRYLD